MTSSHVPFSDLPFCDLVAGATYLGGTKGTLADEPISKILRVGNQGGIRARGPATAPELVALFSIRTHEDWPDRVDHRSGVLEYHGDNRTPGAPLLQKGNQALRGAFERGFGSVPARRQSPPFFVFASSLTGGGRSVDFLGLAVPGAVTKAEEDWLVAKWFTGTAGRYENYLAAFTLLDVPVISRAWIDQLQAGDVTGSACPTNYRHWIETGQRRSSGTVG